MMLLLGWVQGCFLASSFYLKKYNEFKDWHFANIVLFFNCEDKNPGENVMSGFTPGMEVRKSWTQRSES